MIASDLTTSSSARPLHEGTLIALLEDALGAPRERAFSERMGRDAFTEFSSTQMLDRAKRIAAALHARGLGKGDRAVVIADNGCDWIASAFGILLAAGTLVPVFKTLADDQLAHILKDSEARFAFVETGAVAARVAAVAPAVRLVIFDTNGEHSLEAFEASATASSAGAAEAARAATTPHDLAVLIYTSGTTGQPKGVMLSHGNLTSNAVATQSFLFRPADPVSPTMHVLPFAHVMAMSGVLTGIVNRAEQVITRPEFFTADLKDVRPVTLAVVPRLLEKLLGAMQMIAARLPAAKELAAPPFETARRFAEADLAGDVSPELRAEHDAAERAVYATVRAALGFDRIALMGTGSAAMHPDIAKTYYGVGLPLSEGYGMTEAGPAVTIARRGELRFGSVGRPIDDVRIRTAEDGEIEVMSPGLMLGYYHRPEETPFTDDGWYKTGDVGRIDEDGFLWLTDRKKEIFKTTTGKFVAPARVEAAIQRSMFVEQATVVGDGKSFPIALISPNWALVRSVLKIDESVAQADAAQRPDVLALVEREVANATADLASFESVRYASVLAHEFTIEGGELSPSMKTKRRVVETRYAAAIDAVYARADTSDCR